MNEDDAMKMQRLKRLSDVFNDANEDSRAQITRDGVDLIRRQAAEIDRLTLRWSSEKPTIAGVYLMRERGRKSSVVFGTISAQSIKNPSPWGAHYEYAGPITISDPEDRNQS